MDFDAAAEKLELTAKERRVEQARVTGGAAWSNPEDARRTIQVARILQIVQQIADDPATSTSDRLTATKLLLDKSLPSLQSMDMTIGREEDNSDPNVIKAKLAMLIEKAGPALLSEILGERAKSLPTVIEGKVGEVDVEDPPKQRNIGD